jgi:hypothetical protein
MVTARCSVIPTMASIAIASMERFRTKLSNKPTTGNIVAQSKGFMLPAGNCGCKAR